MFSDASENVRGRQIECEENGAILSKQEGEDQGKCVCACVRKGGEEERKGKVSISIHPPAFELQKDNVACRKSNIKVVRCFALDSNKKQRRRH